MVFFLRPEYGFRVFGFSIKEIVHRVSTRVWSASLRAGYSKGYRNPDIFIYIEGKLKPGDTVQADFDGNGFVFHVEQVTLASTAPNENKKGLTETFTCAKCQTTFSTEVLPHSTVICKNCASNLVSKTQVAQMQSESKPAQTETIPSAPPAVGFTIPENTSSGVAAQPA